MMNNNILSDVPHFKTDLFVPHYRNCECGRWRITHLGLGFDHGYITGVSVVENMPILSRRNDENPPRYESWMAISPHEIESQELCCRHAYSNTIIMGLGLGWVAINSAFNKNVKNITIVENDPDIIDLFDQSDALKDVPKNIVNKIKITCANALDWKDDSLKTDFLYIDIWKNLAEPSVLSDVRRMQDNIQADVIYFWGQELIIYSELQKSRLKDEKINNNVIRDCATNIIKLPLLIPFNIDYASMIMKVVEQRIKRRLPITR